MTTKAELQAQVESLTEENEKLKARIESPTEKEFVSLKSRMATMSSEHQRMKRQLKMTTHEHGIFESLVSEMKAHVSPLEGLPPDFNVRKPAGKIEEHLVIHLSDEHADEVVEPHKVGGVEKFDFPIALCRAEKYVDEIVEFTKKNLNNYHFPVLHILSYGDHSNGEIHDAASRSYYRNMFKNSLSIGQMQALMIRDLAKHFPKVKVYCVPGNHGRRTRKKEHDGAKNNWDYLISETANLLLKDIKNVEFAIPDCFCIIVDINGHAFCISHGDDIKSWNSIPWYGMERKTRRLTSLHNTHGQHIKYFVFGHFHSCSSIQDLDGETIINGAWVASDPYVYNAFSGFREPTQLIHGVHKKHGITWRLPIKLRDEAREAAGPKRYHPILSQDLMQ